MEILMICWIQELCYQTCTLPIVLWQEILMPEKEANTGFSIKAATAIITIPKWKWLKYVYSNIWMLLISYEFHYSLVINKDNRAFASEWFWSFFFPSNTMLLQNATENLGSLGLKKSEE